MESPTPDRHDDEHRRAWDAIPWVLNGRASAAEVEAVSRHLPHCADCRDEWRFQAQLRDGIAAAAAPVPDAAPALAKFWSRIDHEGSATGDESAAHVASRPPAPSSFAARRGHAANTTRWLVAAVAMQAVGIVALTAMLWARGTPPAAAYVTLAAPARPVASAALRLVPAPTLAVGALGALLERCGTGIVASNADGSILTLALRPGTGLADALRRLRAEPGVLLAEPLVGVVADGQGDAERAGPTADGSGALPTVADPALRGSRR